MQSLDANKTCRLCGETGHLAKTCPERECRKCKGKCHTGADCPIPLCARCHELGHQKDGCQKAPPKCGKCNGPHKTDNCRDSTNRAPRTKPQSFVKVNKDWKYATDCLTEEQQTLADEFQQLRNIRLGDVAVAVSSVNEDARTAPHLGDADEDAETASHLGDVDDGVAPVSWGVVLKKASENVDW